MENKIKTFVDRLQNETIADLMFRVSISEILIEQDYVIDINRQISLLHEIADDLEDCMRLYVETHEGIDDLVDAFGGEV